LFFKIGRLGKKKEVKPIPEPVSTPLIRTRRRYKTNYSPAVSNQRESPRFRSQRKEEIGIYKLEVELAHLPCCFKRLSNLLCKSDQGYIRIDHLIVSPYGLFIVKANNLAGMIVGEETAANWYQAITWRVKAFPNPLQENQSSIQFLKERLSLKEDIPFFSYVTFNRRCDLKIVSASVFYDIDAHAAIFKLTQSLPVLLNETEVLELYDQLIQLNITDLNIRNEYSARVRRQRMSKRPQFGDIRCSTCQRPVSERVARHCLAHPKKFDWQIYCAKHQKEITRLLNPNNAYPRN